MSAVLTPIKALASSITRRLSSDSVTPKSDATEATPMDLERALPLPPPPQKEVVKEQKQEGDKTACRIHIVDVGAARHQGDRAYQEDRYLSIAPSATIAPTITPATATSPIRENVHALYGIYDGHGGHLVAEHAQQNLHRCLFNSPHFAKGEYEDAMRDAFKKEDALLQQKMEAENVERGGSTAVLCLADLSQGSLTVGNVGDSRAVLAIKDDSGKYQAHRITRDFKPTDPDERHRIERNGGEITEETGRIGAINMSRALGDFIYKTPQNQAENPSGYLARAVRDGANVKGDFISNEPLVQQFNLLQCGEAPFLVAGSDGVFGEMTDQQVVETVAKMRSERSATAQAIVDTIVKGIGDLEYSDNVSCIVAFFNHPPANPAPPPKPEAAPPAAPEHAMIALTKPTAHAPSDVSSAPNASASSHEPSHSSSAIEKAQHHHHHHHHHHSSPHVQKTSQHVGPDQRTKFIDLPNGERGRVFEQTLFPREE